MNRTKLVNNVKEELFDIAKKVHKEHGRLQLPENAGDASVKNYEDEAKQYHNALRDANLKIQSLEQHNAVLAEKSSNAEETITMLIKRIEELEKCAELSDHCVGFNALEQRNSMMRTEDVTQRTTNTNLVINQCQPGDTLCKKNACTTTLIPMTALRDKNEEIAELERKIFELLEVNAFYSSIVSQQDEEEKIGHAKGTTKASLQSDATNISALKSHISIITNQKITLQRLVKQIEDESRLCVYENQKLRKQCSDLEAEIFELGRSEQIPQVFQSNPPGSKASFSRVRPQTNMDSRQGSDLSSHPRIPLHLVALPQNHTDRNMCLKNPDLSSFHTIPPRQNQQLPLSCPRLDIPSLARIKIRNSTSRERALLERLKLYEDYIAQIRTSEVDRQQAFDEMERNRAELFTHMNDQIEKQKYEIECLEKENSKLREVLNVAQGTFRSVDQAKATNDCLPTGETHDVQTQTPDHPLTIPTEQGSKDDGRGDGKKSPVQERATEGFHNDITQDLVYIEEKKRAEIVLQHTSAVLENLVAWYHSWMSLVAYTHNHHIGNKDVIPAESLTVRPEPKFIMSEKVHTTSFNIPGDYIQEALSESIADDASTRFNQVKKALRLFQKEIFSKYSSVVETFFSLYQSTLAHFNKLGKLCSVQSTDIIFDDPNCNDDMCLVRDILCEIKKMSLPQCATEMCYRDRLSERFAESPFSIDNTNIDANFTQLSQHSEFKEQTHFDQLLSRSDGTQTNLENLSQEILIRDQLLQTSPVSITEGTREPCIFLRTDDESEKHNKISISAQVKSPQFVNRRSGENIIHELCKRELVLEREVSTEKACGNKFTRIDPTSTNDTNIEGDMRCLHVEKKDMTSDFCSKTSCFRTNTDIPHNTYSAENNSHSSVLSVLSDDKQISSNQQHSCSDTSSCSHLDCSSEAVIQVREAKSETNNFAISSTIEEIFMRDTFIPALSCPHSEAHKRIRLASISMLREKDSLDDIKQQSSRTDLSETKVEKQWLKPSSSDDERDDMSFKAEFDPFT